MATSEVNKVSAVWKFRTGRTYLNMPLFFFSRGTLTSSSGMSVSGATELCSGPASNRRLNIVYPTASSIQIVLRKRYCIHMAMVNTQLLACKQTKKKALHARNYLHWWLEIIISLELRNLVFIDLLRRIRKKIEPWQAEVDGSLHQQRRSWLWTGSAPTETQENWMLCS